MVSWSGCAPRTAAPCFLGAGAKGASACRSELHGQRDLPQEGSAAGGEARRSGGEGLPPRARLRRRQDYLRAYRRGRRRTGAFVILYIVANQEGSPRLGITVSRKVGNSVVRHRVKRRVREAYRRWPGRHELPAADLVVHAKPAAATASSQELGQELIALLESRRGR
jgi:ribonuclease P protein component